MPRNLFQVIFGFGLSNKSYNGLPDRQQLARQLPGRRGLSGVILSRGRAVLRPGQRVLQPRGKSTCPRPVPGHLLYWSRPSPRPGSATPRRTCLSSRWPRRSSCPRSSRRTRRARREAWHEDRGCAQPVPVGRAERREPGGGPGGRRRSPRSGMTWSCSNGAATTSRAGPRPGRRHCPARVVWNGGRTAGPARGLRSSRPDVVHIHNTFPLLSARSCTRAGRSACPSSRPCTTTSWPVPAVTSSGTAPCATTARPGLRPRRCGTAVTAARGRPPRRSHSRPWRIAGPGGRW